MLTHLTINNYMLIEHLDLQLRKGMTAITGETGTGKSVLLGALGLALGEKADGDKVRLECDKADITATFSLDDLEDARQWLIEHDLSHADDCLLRRVIAKDGRSRAFINSQPVPLQQIRALSELLIDIHSQHAHQSLLSKNSHQKLLDEYCQQQLLASNVAKEYKHWHNLNNQTIKLRDNADEMNARFQLLHYQVEELDKLDIGSDELEQLEQQQQTLANAESIIHKSQQLSSLCDGDDACTDNSTSIRELLNRAIAVLQSIRPQTDAFININELLNNALINVDEAHNSLQHEMQGIEIDPERLQFVESRLTSIYDISRKHNIAPSEIASKHIELSHELSGLSGGDDALAELEQQTSDAYEQFISSAKLLSKKRQLAAKELTDNINTQLQTLAMGGANFLVAVTQQLEKPNSNGIDDIEFLISTNPGQPHKPLNKVVSGGELSRISLAIQVATAQTSQVATLVFDEVDVGIGGDTANVVGELLNQLGKKSQVLCITHLAQVASKANYHWQVSKDTQNNSAATHIVELDNNLKIEEIARMISGNILSNESIAHAKLMMGQTQNVQH
jgi:DNA repair protein RecN (Recombination protein N)